MTHFKEKDWCVYVLRCRNDALYTGITNNLAKRLREHEKGTGSKFVRAWSPFELVKVIPCSEASEARKLECFIKGLTRQRKLEYLGLG